MKKMNPENDDILCLEKSDQSKVRVLSVRVDGKEKEHAKKTDPKLKNNSDV
jgi:hypothetical protein